MISYVFIVTTPRAGSTLAQSLLLNIDGIVSAPETHFFSLLNSKNFMRPEFYNIDEYLSTPYEAIGAKPPSLSRFKFGWKKLAMKDFKSKIDNFVLKGLGKCFLEKTPMHLHYMESIKKEFDNALFIHVERDMYDNVMSLNRATNTYPSGWGGGRSLDKCVDRWLYDKSIHDKYRQEDGHIFFDYQYIVSDPSGYISRVAEILDLSWGGEVNINKNKNIIGSNEPWKSNNLKQVGDVEKYSNVLTRLEFEKLYLQGGK